MNSTPSLPNLSRRQFVKSTAAALATTAVASNALAREKKGIKLGFDNFSVRNMGWNAGEVNDYAAAQKVDVVLFSDLKVYESHKPTYLRDLKSVPPTR